MDLKEVDMRKHESIRNGLPRYALLVMVLWPGMMLLAQGSANNNGASGSAFLNIGVGARAMGMAGAVGATIDDPTALYWNPAGIAGLQGIRIAAEHNQWVADMNHEFFGLVVPLNDQFNIGLSVVYFSSGDIEITTIDEPRGTGRMYNTSDLSLGGTISWVVTSDLSVGATLKYIKNSLYTVSAQGIAFDAGAVFNTRFHSLCIALAATNLSANREYRGDALDFEYPPPYPGAEAIRASFNNTPFSLPLTYRAGISLEVFELIDQPMEGHTVHMAVDLVQPWDGPEKVSLGAEYAFDKTFFARTGYIFNADELGFNAGGGVRIGMGGTTVDLNYAVSTLQRFSAVHRIGLGIAL
jgi:hypothetical protein